MNGNQDDNFYTAIKHCIEELGRDGAGPWWEGDLQFQLGRCLMCSLNGASDLLELKPPPSFLAAWPQPMTRRLRALNYAAKQFPDFTYWPPNTNKCWAVELKLWSLEGGLGLRNQITGCMRGIENDADKVLKMLQSSDGYCGGLVLSVVNIPNTFAVPRAYSSDHFKKKLIERIDVSRTSGPASGPLNNLVAGGGHWCVAIKKINGAKVEEFEVYTSLPNFPDLFQKG